MDGITTTQVCKQPLITQGIVVVMLAVVVVRVAERHAVAFAKGQDRVVVGGQV